MANLGERVSGEPVQGAPTDAASEPGDAGPRPLIERIGLGAIAIVVAGLFGTVAYVTLTNGELFLGIMAAAGALMTVWAAASTLRRG